MNAIGDVERLNRNDCETAQTEIVLETRSYCPVTRQVGAYLAELLLAKNYEVHGVKRPISLFNTNRI